MDICQTCLRAQRDGFRKEIRCQGFHQVAKGNKCSSQEKLTKLNEENDIFWKFYKRIEPGLLIGKSYYDYSAINLGFDIFCINTSDQQTWILDRILILVDIIEELREEARKKNG